MASVTQFFMVQSMVAQDTSCFQAMEQLLEQVYQLRQLRAARSFMRLVELMQHLPASAVCLQLRRADYLARAQLLLTWHMTQHKQRLLPANP